MLRQLTAAQVSIHVAMAVALLAVVPGPGAAQSPALAPAAPRPRAPLDENALRYYAALGQKARVAAEARRLAKLDPAWRLPGDLWTARPGRTDEGPLWTLYAQNRFDELGAAITARKAVEPAWTPSEDLAGKVKAKLLRARIVALAATEDWHAIVASFRETGIAWAQDDAEALWIIAEAYAHENDCGEAYVVFQTLLAHHGDPQERRATVERAIALVPMSYVEKLIAMGRADEGGRSEWAPIAHDITRARISAFLHDEPANEPSAEDLARFAEVAKAAADPNEPALIAWYDFKKRNYPQALDWFKFVIARGGDAMIAHGLAHTLRKLDRKREAEEVAYAWREPLVNNSILFIDLLEEDFTREQPPFIEPERVARYAQVTVATESGEGAQALAWYAYNTCQYPLALKWFEHAVAWLPKEATVYGYALALQRMKRTREFREVVNRYDGLFPKVVALAFDDGRRTPPAPCEADLAMPSAPPRAQLFALQSGPDWTGRTMADTLRPQLAGPAGRRAALPADATFARARVPSPDAVAGGGEGLPALAKKTDFPFAAGPANPMRFSASRTVSTEEGARGQEPPAPLVARRVPGVGAMPYERYGFTLLRGWDGTADASSPTAAERPTAAGTLWSLQGVGQGVGQGSLEVSLRSGASFQPSATAPDTASRRGAARAVAESVPADRRSP